MMAIVAPVNVWQYFTFNNCPPTLQLHQHLFYNGDKLYLKCAHSLTINGAEMEAIKQTQIPV